MWSLKKLMKVMIKRIRNNLAGVLISISSPSLRALHKAGRSNPVKNYKLDRHAPLKGGLAMTIVKEQ
jgi:hypothetical protein